MMQNKKVNWSERSAFPLWNKSDAEQLCLCWCHDLKSNNRTPTGNKPLSDRVALVVLLEDGLPKKGSTTKYFHQCGGGGLDYKLSTSLKVASISVPTPARPRVPKRSPIQALFWPNVALLQWDHCIDSQYVDSTAVGVWANRLWPTLRLTRILSN